MGEIKTDLFVVRRGESFTNETEDDVCLIAEKHTHLDILRYVVDDLGWEEAMMHLQSLKPVEVK
jgi:uncharacterized protein YtpQ (UPF0354 family)